MCVSVCNVSLQGDTKANTLSMDTTNPSASFLANIKYVIYVYLTVV